MSFDTLGFLQHYNIPHVTEGHKHSRHGWVNVSCPFCIGNPGWHLGFEYSNDRWSCWRGCGYHRTWDVVAALLEREGFGRREAAEAMRQFKGRPTARWKKAPPSDNRILELPAGLQSLTARAHRYLEGRNYNPEMLEALWGLQSTSNFGDMSYRIFIPIHLNNRMVSWQCRDITDRSGMKYLAQREDKEIVSNKETLYGIDQATSSKCVIVEGVTGVWRLGPGSVATFGIKYKPAQISMLLAHFSEFHILFDPDPQGIKQAELLGADLSSLGGKVKIWYLDEYDPGDMPQDEADSFMREVGAGGY